jgi:hypothetical protein
MKMRDLLNIAMPFKRSPREPGMVMHRELMGWTGNPDPASGKTLRAVNGKELYGLPCARCGVYYAAELPSCPVCNSTERTPPVLKPVWPIHVPRPQPGVPAQEKILAGLAVINQELLATPSPGMTMARAT